MINGPPGTAAVWNVSFSGPKVPLQHCSTPAAGIFSDRSEFLPNGHGRSVPAKHRLRISGVVLHMLHSGPSIAKEFAQSSPLRSAAYQPEPLLLPRLYSDARRCCWGSG